MGFIDYREIRRVQDRKGRFESDQAWIRDPRTISTYEIGMICDNKDPLSQGRVKVYFPLYGDNFISDWCPVIKQYAGDGQGMWFLPEIEQKVICGFFDYDMSYPFVVGPVFGPKCAPPVDDPASNNIKILTSKTGSSYIILDDTDGDEKLIVSFNDDKMQILMDSKGLAIKNDDGEIEIDCAENITIEADDEASFVFEKALKIEAEEDIVIESGKGIGFKASGDVICKGSKIKIKGDGVTAQMKQIAVKDDQVVGVDMHDIMVPSSTGLVKVPSIPHPYLGKLNDKLSEDVLVKDKAVAVKGSKCEFGAPGHIAMPPGVQFGKPPTNKGEVTLLTVNTVKVNGKDVAVLGSKAKTCCDPSDQPMGTIIAAGVSVPIPILMQGFDPNEYARTGGMIMNTRTPMAGAGAGANNNPVMSNPKWSATQANLGDEVKLEVSLAGQYEGAAVQFIIWEQGADMNTDLPAGKVVGNNKGGKAFATWNYVYVHDEDNPLTEKPKFTFVAQSFKCADVTCAEAVEFGVKIDVKCIDSLGEIITDVPYRLSISGQEGKVGADGKITVDSAVPGETIELDLTGQ